MHLCNWFFQSVKDGKFDPQLVFLFSDDAWFSTPGEVNSQNNRYSSEENPGLIHELPFHDEKRALWCAMEVSRIIGSIFYDKGLNVVRYTNNILRTFFSELTEE
jgi:hypothetical protein